ncbi:MAG: PD40 domain-containing protein [Acidobacteriia bacterium]|nr:PD40 domain-containing protein [Terriglobia bacterium]
MRQGYWFEDIEVDVDGFQVSRQGKLLPLEPRAIRVLLLLLERRGRLVTKDQLMRTVWGETFVTDNALTRVIAQLRRELGDDAKRGRIIETVPTQGYRFIASVSQEGPASKPVQARRDHRRLAAVLIFLPAALLMAGGLAWRYVGRTVTRLPGTLRTIQLTTSTGLDHSPTFSPDGSRIAFSSDRSGGFEIYLRPSRAAGREVQLTQDGGENVHPALAPDGQEIAYHSAAKGGIWVIPSLGGHARMVSEFGAEPAWSPDGKWIAFRSGGFLSLSIAETTPPIGSRLWVVAREGGTPRQVTHTDQPPGAHGAPSWSPDGKRLLFASSEVNGKLWTVALQDGKLVPLPLPEGFYLQPIFSPDGRSVYYASRSEDLSFGLWRVRLGFRGEPPVALTQTGHALPVDVSVSPDGRKLSYGLISSTSSLAVLPVSLSSGEAAGQAKLVREDTSFRNTFPAFSPDGRRIAFHVRRRGVEADIYVMNADGGGMEQLTAHPGPDMMPSWTPDGKAVAYSSNRDGAFRLWRVSIENGKEELVTKAVLPRRLTRLSPDGRTVVSQESTREGLALWSLDLEQGRTRRLTDPGKESIGYPCWSRDSRWLAAEKTELDDRQIVVIPATGGAARALTSQRGQNWPYSWSPDNQRIAFAALRNGRWSLWWVDKKTGRQHRLTDPAPLRTYVRYPDWSPAGDRIVYEHSETRGNLYILELR